MLVNYTISSHPLLTSFVDDYVLCTSGNNAITYGGPWPASNETSLGFYLADRPRKHITAHADSLISNKGNCLIGLLTHHNGVVHFEGRYHTFMIQFKANGFNKIFRIPMYECTNKIFAIEDVFGTQTNELYEQLLNAEDIQQMAFFADKFLLFFLNRHNKTAWIYDGITAISRELYDSTVFHTVEQYARKANMSLRNFGRQFTEQTGVSPKLYTKLVRFNQAVKIKTMHPDKNWTTIAVECGYYDQMHLIKDFKQFSGFSPSDFLVKNEAVVVTGTGAEPSDNAVYQPSNRSGIYEQFVVVKRTSI